MSDSQIFHENKTPRDDRPGSRPLRVVSRVVIIFLFLVAVGSGLALALISPSSFRSFFGWGSTPLPVYWEIPDFSLTERSGRRVTLADLKGKVWIANFIYTHCTDTCPFQTAEMAELQKKFAREKDFRLVSISVDPEWDTPEVLAKYAKRFGADAEKWLFLTGEKAAIYRLAQKGFRLSVVDPREEILRPGPSSFLEWLTPRLAHAHHPGPAQPFIHSSRFVLVDQKAQVRGLYAGISAPSAAPKGQFVPVYDDETLKRLRRDVRTLLRENLR